ncbi:MAG: hypothetical protein WBJ30_04240 [Tepidanaerobacteraceae bacterium]|jgi:hypothetical protein|nr:hypothetical protein [Tepidanaerobacteraceae bacterium]
MNNKKNNIPFEDELLAGIVGGMAVGVDCGLQENNFPNWKVLSDEQFHCRSGLSGGLPLLQRTRTPHFLLQ